MKPLRLIHIIWSFLALIALTAALGVLLSVSVVAQEPPPDRPSPPSGRPEPPPDRPLPPPPVGLPATTDSGGGSQGGGVTCLTIHGVVTNLGHRPEPKAPVQLTGADWQSSKLADDNGVYASDCLGIGTALVNVVASPGLNPLTRDVALRLGYKASYEVNLGLYSSQTIPILSYPVMSANQSHVAPGKLLTYTIRAATIPANEVIITDWLPEALTVESVSSTHGQYEIWNNLVTVDVGKLTAGQAVTVTIVASVSPDISSGSIITNRASQLAPGQPAIQTVPISVTVTNNSPLSDSVNANEQLDTPPLTLPVTGGELSH